MKLKKLIPESSVTQGKKKKHSVKSETWKSKSHFLINFAAVIYRGAVF